MKQNRFLLENSAEIFGCGSFNLWGCSPHAPGNMGCCIPNCASRRRKKAIEKKIFCSAFSQKICASFMSEGQNLKLNALCLRGGMGRRKPPYTTTLCECAQVLREAHDGSGPATAGAWRRHQPPHESTLALFSKIISPRSYARKGITWDATSTVAGGVGRAAPQSKSPRILHIRGRAVNEMRYENSIKKRKMQSLS